MEKGKFFEIVIEAIQQAIKDSNETNIIRNHTFVDHVGLKREFDVVLESDINGFKMTIAIECKDFKRKLGVTYIEAFENKCNGISQINKKVVISRNGFQSGAIAKAKAYGIDLLLLKQISEEKVLSWLQMSVPKPISIIRKLSRPRVLFIDEPFEVTPEDIIVIEANEIRTTVLNFMKEVVNQDLQPLQIYISKYPPNEKKKIMEMKVDFPNAYLERQGKKYRISTLWFDVEESYEEQKSKISFDEYRGIEAKGGGVESVTVVSENQDIFSLVKKENGKRIDIIAKVVIGSEEKLMKIGEMQVEKIDPISDDS